MKTMISNKKNDKMKADALNACFERMLEKEESVDTCVADYPQYSAELKPLLETMKVAQDIRTITPDPSFRARARYEFRSALHDSIAPKKPLIVWRWGWANIASTVGVLILTSMGGAVAASNNSMPGQPLYQVKRTVEAGQLTLAFSQSAKARLYATLADRRVGEIVYAATQGNVTLTENLTQQFTKDLSMVSSIAAPSRSLTSGGGAKQGDSSATAGSLPEYSDSTVKPSNDNTGAMAAAPSLSNTPSQSSVASAAPVPATSVTLTQTQNSFSSIDDKALLKMVQQYSIKNMAELSSLLDKAPASVRPALLEAIQAAASGYGQILGP
jgi:hypothetical protein